MKTSPARAKSRPRSRMVLRRFASVHVMATRSMYPQYWRQSSTLVASAFRKSPPQAVRLPLFLRDRVADPVAERVHLHVVGRGPAGERELIPLPPALEG